jgi:hypothetical protein
MCVRGSWRQGGSEDPRMRTEPSTGSEGSHGALHAVQLEVEADLFATVQLSFRVT